MFVSFGSFGEGENLGRWTKKVKYKRKKLLLCIGWSRQTQPYFSTRSLHFSFPFLFCLFTTSDLTLGRDRCPHSQAWRRRRRWFVRCRSCLVPTLERTRRNRASRQRDRRGRHQPARHHGPGPDASGPYRPDPVRFPAGPALTHRDPAAADQYQEDGLWSRCGRGRSGPADRGVLGRRGRGPVPGGGHEGHGRES